MAADVVIVGQGYVGLPLAQEATKAGLTVIGYDITQSLVDALNSGVSHVDDLSDADIAEMIAGGYQATTDEARIGEAKTVVICVPTPLSDEGGPDLRAVEGATAAIGRNLKAGMTVILESTTYPGTTDEVVRPILEEASGLTAGKDFHLAFSPERIDPGNEKFGAKNTPKVVGGHTPACAERCADFYRAFVDSAPVLEKAIAEQAGLGWIGKNTLVLNRKAGSYFFLGELFVDMPLPVDAPHGTEHCGRCTACMDICPTAAFVAPYTLDKTVEMTGVPAAQLEALANLYADRTGNGEYRGNIMEAIYAVNCLDRQESSDPADYDTAAAKAEKVAPVWGEFIARSSMSCGYWPVKATGTPHPIDATGAAPIVLVGTTRDPATPYEWATRVHEQMPDSRLITFEGDGHTAYTRSNDCVDGAVDAYLLDGTLPDEDLRC